jgi:hypothetical protein
MKRLCVWLLAFLLAAGIVSGQTVLINSFSSGPLPAGWIVASGNWQVKDGKLYQADTKETMAVLNIPCDQSGVMQYEFDVQYVDGFEDDYGGFGFHIMVTNPSRGRSWGDGTSGLLWLTWDKAAYGPGVFAQAYASTGPTQMGLYPPRDIMKAGNNLPLPASYMRPEAFNVTIPVKIVVDTNAGEIRVYDPLDMNFFYRFKADIPIKSGKYIALRTNSLAVAFDNLKVTKLQ